MNPAADDLDGGILARLCAGRRLARQGLWLRAARSTQDEARRLARVHGAGVLVVADTQTLGRGRLGRTWWSPPGSGLWLSLVLAPARPRAEWPFLSALAALALREALGTSAGIECGIKWPNDLLARGRKIAGILAEAGAEPWLVLGVGVNVTQGPEDFPEALRDWSTSMRIECGRTVPEGGAGRASATAPIDRAAVLAAFLGAIDRWMARFETDGPSSSLDELRRASLLLGREVEIAPAPDAPVLRGRVCDLGPCGELVLEPARESGGGQRVMVSGGEVLGIRPPLMETRARADRTARA